MDVKKLVARLRKRLSHKGELRRGAISRAAAHMGIGKSTVHAWMHDVVPNKHLAPTITAFLEADDVDLTPKKTGPKKKITLVD